MPRVWGGCVGRTGRGGHRGGVRGAAESPGLSLQRLQWCGQALGCELPGSFEHQPLQGGGGRIAAAGTVWGVGTDHNSADSF